jgi:hypothetical protein
LAAQFARAPKPMHTLPNHCGRRRTEAPALKITGESMKRLTTLLFAVVSCFALSPALLGQTATAAPTQARVAHPAISAEEIKAAATVYTGKFVFEFTVTVDSVLYGTDTYICTADASVDDVGTTGDNFYTETAAVSAYRSGTTVKCTVTIPYSWTLVSGTTDMVSIDYAITAPGPGSSTTYILPSRTTTHTLGSIKVPLSGSTTTTVITATM